MQRQATEGRDELEGPGGWLAHLRSLGAYYYEVGSAVTSLSVGDRVFGMIPGNMGNVMRSPASLVSKVPPRETVIGAASMPVAYLTALYAL